MVNVMGRKSAQVDQMSVFASVLLKVIRHFHYGNDSKNRNKDLDARDILKEGEIKTLYLLVCGSKDKSSKVIAQFGN